MVPNLMKIVDNFIISRNPPSYAPMGGKPKPFCERAGEKNMYFIFLAITTMHARSFIDGYSSSDQVFPEIEPFISQLPHQIFLSFMYLRGPYLIQLLLPVVHPVKIFHRKFSILITQPNYLVINIDIILKNSANLFH